MKFLTGVMLGLMLVSCSNQKSEKEEVLKDTLVIEPAPQANEKPEADAPPPADLSIEGAWSEGGLTPTLIITEDSVFNPDDQYSARYVKEGEWAIFYYPDEEVHIKAYKTHPDTLILESVSTRTKYWRLKNP